VSGRPERLAERLEALVAIPSESRDESAILGWIRERLPATFTVHDDRDAVLFAMPERRPGAPLVVLAGHVDTVPIGVCVPGRRGDTIVGRGSADMKAGLAVMLELGDAIAAQEIAGDVDVGLLFFGREELPFGESALMPFLDRTPAVREAALAVVMEPTANRLEVGCLGNLTATVTVTGEAAHTARPWLGRNAIHGAIEALAPFADLPPRDVTIDGLTYREVASVTTIAGGTATNVVPDRVTATVNLRYAPTHSREEAERRLRELLGHPSARVDVVGNAPPGPVPSGNPLVDRLRTAGDLAVGPKQAWTPVAELGLAGIDGVNFGPGDPEYAHRDDEQVDVASLERSYDVVRAFLGGRGQAMEG
jgi:succinyl-diaminopimelate desuccinylase